MKSWPSWHPGQELKAEHLIGLEDFLLARSSIAETFWHGLEFFEVGTSLRARNEGGTLFVEASWLRGVTPGGHPVVLGHDDKLSGTVSLGGANSVVIDAAIVVNPREQSEKLVFEVGRAPEWNEEAKPGVRNPSKLELGRFRWLSDGSLEMLRRPMVRRFDALRPLDHAWRHWVEPLSSAIGVLVKDLEREKPPFTLWVISLSVELQRLSFEWPSIPIGEVLRRLRLVNWLRILPKERPASIDSLDQESAFFEDEELNGDELPERLAGLLGAKVPRRGRMDADQALNPDDVICTWVDRFWEVKFLRALTGGTLELHIPTQANPPQSLSLQNRDLTYVRSVDGNPKGNLMVYPLGPMPISVGSVYRFRMSKVVPSGLESAEFHFLRDMDDD